MNSKQPKMKRRNLRLKKMIARKREIELEA